MMNATNASSPTINPKLKSLAKDLTREFPRSPRETLAGYILAARCVDKARATLAGTAGEYHFNCPLDRLFLDFAGLKGEDLAEVLAAGADDAEVARWIEEHATKRPRIEIVKFNNRYRDWQLSELPDEMAEYMEDYIPKFIPAGRVIYRVFDVFDIEEKRL